MSKEIKKGIPCRRCGDFFAPRGDEFYCPKCIKKIKKETKEHARRNNRNKIG